MMRTLFATLAGVLIANNLSAAEMLTIEVDYDDGDYSMNSEVWFDAPLEDVYEVFRRWDYSTKFSSTIVEARDVEADAKGRPQFFVRNRGCVLFFCRTFQRQGYVVSETNQRLLAFTDPEISDFHRSDESWSFSVKDGGTVVVYDLKMRPKFWIPPGIGPYMIKKKLKNNGGRAIDRIEAIAQSLAVE